MNFRLAERKDLPKIKRVFKKIVDHMYKNNIPIWDDIFPCDFFEEDIETRHLYLLEDGETVVAALALYDSNEGESYIRWQDTKEKALYINRFGVNVDYLRQGIGGVMLKYAMEVAKQKGVGSLRLFVVEINKPAINLYVKHGFKQAEGVYEEHIEDYILREYGFELKI